MHLREVVTSSYILIQAEWPAGEARALIERVNVTHVIVLRTKPQDYYTSTRRPRYSTSWTTCAGIRSPTRTASLSKRCSTSMNTPPRPNQMPMHLPKAPLPAPS